MMTTLAVVLLVVVGVPAIFITTRQAISYSRALATHRRLTSRIDKISTAVIMHHLRRNPEDPYNGSISEYHETLELHKRCVASWVDTPLPTTRIAALVHAGVEPLHWRSAEELTDDDLSTVAGLHDLTSFNRDVTDTAERFYIRLVHSRVTSELSHLALLHSGLIPRDVAQRKLSIYRRLNEEDFTL